MPCYRPACCAPLCSGPPADSRTKWMPGTTRSAGRSGAGSSGAAPAASSRRGSVSSNRRPPRTRAQRPAARTLRTQSRLGPYGSETRKPSRSGSGITGVRYRRPDRRPRWTMRATGDSRRPATVPMTRLGSRRLNRARRSAKVTEAIALAGAGHRGGLEGAVGHVPLGEDAVVAAVGDDLAQGRLEDRLELGVVLARADAVGARVDLLADDLEVVALAGDLGVVGGDREVGQGGVGPAELDLEDHLGAAVQGAGLGAAGAAAGLLGGDQLLVDGAGLEGDGLAAEVGHGPDALGVAAGDQDRGAGLEVLEEADLLGPLGG